MTAGETHQAIEAIFRIKRARLIGGLARVVRNVDLAEELAQDALVIAPCPNGLGPAFRPIPAIV
jgi:predicted RNA polymerase sigma factor